MHTLAGHRHAIRALAYHPGPESILASAGDDRCIRLWNPSVGTEMALLDCRRDGILCLAFSPDGQRLASGGRAGALTVWNVEERRPDPGTSSCSGPIITLSFTVDGRAILAALRSQQYGGEPGRLVCWNLSPLYPPQGLDWSGDVESVGIAPSRHLLAIAGQHRGVELWEVGRQREPEPNFWLPARIRALCFSTNQGRTLAVASGRIVQLYDLESRQWVMRCQGHRGDINAVAFSPDGTMLLTGGMDRSVRLWEVASGRELAAWDWKLGTINAVAFSSDGMTAAAGGQKSDVVVWDIG